MSYDEIDAKITLPIAASAHYTPNKERQITLQSQSMVQSPFIHTQCTSSTNSSKDKSWLSTMQKAQNCMAGKLYEAAIFQFTLALQTIEQNAVHRSHSFHSATLKVLYKRAHCYFCIKKLDRAVEDYTKLIHIAPSNAAFFNKRAECFTILQKHSQALEDYNSALELYTIHPIEKSRQFFAHHSDDVRVLYINRSRVFRELKQTSNALEALALAELIEGGNSRASEITYERSQIFLQCHQKELALKELDRLMDLDVQNLADLRRSSKVKTPYDPASVLLTRADLLVSQSQFEESSYCEDQKMDRTENGFTETRESCAISSVFMCFPYQRASLYTCAKPQLESAEARSLAHKAIHCYTQILDADPENIDVLRRRAVSSILLLRDFRQSQKDLESALELDPQDVNVMLMIAGVHAQKGEHDTAIAKVSQIIHNHPFCIDALFLCAQLNEQIERYEQAAETYATVLSAALEGRGRCLPTSPDVLLLTGDVFSGADTDAKNACNSNENMTQVIAQAHFQRARNFVRSTRFQNAIDDYTEVLKTFPNHLEAQLEKQSAQESLAKQLQAQADEAISWLLACDTHDASPTDNVNSLHSLEKDVDSMQKKRKKKKKKKKFPQLEQNEIESSPAPLFKTSKTAEIAQEQESKADETIECDTDMNSIRILNVTSRESVWESMEQAADVDVRSDDTKTISSVRFDERYLKKRQKQMENIKKDLLNACQARDLSMIQHVIQRAERKNMTEQLQSQLNQAQHILSQLSIEPTLSCAHLNINYDRALQNERSEVAISAQLRAKDEEIAHLRQQLQRCDCHTKIPSPEPNSQKRPLFPLQIPESINFSIDRLINCIGPTRTSDFTRCNILSYLRNLFQLTGSTLPIVFYPTGSFPTKTYLPTADLDVCLLLPKANESSALLSIMHILCSIANDSARDREVARRKETHVVRNVSFINAHVKLIKCTINNVAVDLTVNRFGALGALVLLDYMDLRVGQAHLLKRSLMLIKAWCLHESMAFDSADAPMSVLGSSHGMFSTYALSTIVMAIYNMRGTRISNPFQALYEFLDCMAEFDWKKDAWTLYGVISLNKVHRSHAYSNLKCSAHFIRYKDVEQIRMKVEKAFGTSVFSNNCNLFAFRCVNIVDPLLETNNLARSVLEEHIPRMRGMFCLGRDCLYRICRSFGDLDGKEAVKKVFRNCTKLYVDRDGWRPDLLSHPRQLYVNMETVCEDEMEEREWRKEARWYSLIPEYLRMDEGNGESDYMRDGDLEVEADGSE